MLKLVAAWAKCRSDTGLGPCQRDCVRKRAGERGINGTVQEDTASHMRGSTVWWAGGGRLPPASRRHLSNKQLNTHMTSTPQTYWASVDQRLLQKVDRVFDAAPVTIWNELLQNARRAGATTVNVHLAQEAGHPLYVKFSDNGEGLDNPGPLLTLASQGWNAEIENEEDPAGMGFFCLSNFACVDVASHEWRASITPAVFRGEIGLEITRGEIPIPGLSLAFQWERVELAYARQKLIEAATYCGIDTINITANEERSPVVVHPKDFMEASVLPPREIPELGARIGITKLLGFGRDVRVTCNFRGVILELHDHELGEHIRLMGTMYLNILVDIQHTRALQLVLPARNALKHTAGRQRLLEEAERTIYEYVIHLQKTRPEHADVQRPAGHTFPHALYLRAREVFGLDIMEADFCLAEYEASWLAHPSTRVLVSPDAQNWRHLEHLVKKHNLTETPLEMFFEKERMVGYSWYDSIPKLTEVKVFVDEKEVPYEEIENGRTNHTDPEYSFAESLGVQLHISDGRIIDLTPDFLATGDSRYSSWDDLDGGYTHVFLREAVKTDVQRLTCIADELCDLLFEYNSDSLSRSLDEQEREFGRDVHAWLFKLCGMTKLALRHGMDIAMDNIDWAVRNEDVVWTLRYDGRGDRQIKLASFQMAGEEDANHKFVCTQPRNTDGVMEEIVSERPVTPERIYAYLQKEHGITEEDGWLVHATPPVVDLDAWEAQNLSSEKEVQS